MVERDRTVFELLRRNIDMLDCAGRTTAVHGDALGEGFAVDNVRIRTNQLDLDGDPTSLWHDGFRVAIPSRVSDQFRPVGAPGR